MSDTESNGKAPAGSSAAELEFRRYEARLGVWKVVLGTVVVGLAGVAIPGAVSWYSAYFENQRKQIELSLSQETAYQQYIKEFFSTAINQDIELRIRFATYFASLSEGEQRELWQVYLKSLTDLRAGMRKKINELERELAEIESLPPERIDYVRRNEVEREKAWAHAEIGYVQIKAAPPPPEAETASDKRARLYRETTDLVQRLADQADAIDAASADVVRFWELYDRDLRRVESLEFARIMIAIGSLLKRLAAEHKPPDDELKRLAGELRFRSEVELTAEAAAQSGPNIQQAQ